jgi:hypothetical protein
MKATISFKSFHFTLDLQLGLIVMIFAPLLF